MSHIFDSSSSSSDETLCIHAGEYTDPFTHASAPSIVMSTAFGLDSEAKFSFNSNPGFCVDKVNENHFSYTRSGNPSVHQLEMKLAALEGGEGAVAFSSGF
jgi:methionine-gamma-lyase